MIGSSAVVDRHSHTNIFQNFSSSMSSFSANISATAGNNAAAVAKDSVASSVHSSSRSSSRDSQTYLVVEVEDSGIGVSASAMAHRFEPFQQAQRMTGGTVSAYWYHRLQVSDRVVYAGLGIVQSFVADAGAQW
jgi:hypothetical protein